jgi:hypothetical protein
MSRPGAAPLATLLSLIGALVHNGNPHGAALIVEQEIDATIFDGTSYCSKVISAGHAPSTFKPIDCVLCYSGSLREIVLRPGKPAAGRPALLGCHEPAPRNLALRQNFSLSTFGRSL